jgi:hypothetical protein
VLASVLASASETRFAAMFDPRFAHSALGSYADSVRPCGSCVSEGHKRAPLIEDARVLLVVGPLPPGAV